jgi:hypothetical protein
MGWTWTNKYESLREMRRARTYGHLCGLDVEAWALVLLVGCGLASGVMTLLT